mmetsp:Transcript_135965/g.378950  ORF Transcript_135965/g.378950 Transcript_135965/m.378950 type:complete len:353 (+) Transcript_135965:294-1352(+)
MNTDSTKPSTKRRPAASPAPLKASGIMAVAIMASMAPPVKPSKAAVEVYRTLSSIEPFVTALGMIKEPTMDKKPVKAKTTNHIRKTRCFFMPWLVNKLAPLNASGKLATKMATKKVKLMAFSFVMNPSINDSGMPSSSSPNHIDSATLLLDTSTGGCWSCSAAQCSTTATPFVGAAAGAAGEASAAVAVATAAAASAPAVGCVVEAARRKALSATMGVVTGAGGHVMVLCIVGSSCCWAATAGPSAAPRWWDLPAPPCGGCAGLAISCVTGAAATEPVGVWAGVSVSPSPGAVRLATASRHRLRPRYRTAPTIPVTSCTKTLAHLMRQSLSQPLPSSLPFAAASSRRSKDSP